MSDTLYDHLSWTDYAIPSHAASGQVQLRVAEVGEGTLATFVAGVHGDEGPWGALALRELLQQPVSVLEGRLRLIMNANPLAQEADARNAPLDHLDLNRSFPGDADGSHTEVLAKALSELLEDSDLVIDLHGGGSWCVNAFVFSFAGSEDLAAEIGAPFIVTAPEKVGTLTQYAKARGARVVAVEMGGRSRDELLWRDRIVGGLQRVLHHEGFFSESPAGAAPHSIPVGPSRVLRPKTGGLFLPTLREEAIGTMVPGGTELGRLLHPHTLATLETFSAPYTQTALLLLRPHICVLEGGAMTYVVAEAS